MSLHCDTVICQDTAIYQEPSTCHANGIYQEIETFQPVAWETVRDDGSPQLIPVRDEPHHASEEHCSKYLPSGARIISSDKRSKSVLCTDQGEWSVWLVDDEGEPIRRAYFKSMRAAAFDYAEYVMGCHSGERAVEMSDIEE